MLERVTFEQSPKEREYAMQESGREDGSSRDISRSKDPGERFQLEDSGAAQGPAGPEQRELGKVWLAMMLQKSRAMRASERILAFPLSGKLLQALNRCSVFIKRLTLFAMWKNDHREA